MNDKEKFMFHLGEAVAITAIVTTPEEAHEAFTAAWLYYKEGKETRLRGAGALLYYNLVAIINEAGEGKANE